MIDLYSWSTPNGEKIHIALEEMGLDYETHPVDLGAGAQFEPEFLEVSPNNKIPAIVHREAGDGRPLALFESGAILLYLAELSGAFLPADPRGRAETVQWLMFQMGGVGPMMGQLFHFLHASPEVLPYAVDRFRTEVERLCRVVDGRLADRDYLAGEYSVADMACYPWLSRAERLEVDLETRPHLRGWLERVGSRPAVGQGMALLGD